MDLSLSKANSVKSSFSKILYEHVFQDLMFVINSNLSSTPQSHHKMKVNMLDIAGFGKFQFFYGIQF